MPPPLLQVKGGNGCKLMHQEDVSKWSSCGQGGQKPLINPLTSNASVIYGNKEYMLSNAMSEMGPSV
eukprot:1803522-Ditylum_brightwellii.AAC.1